MYFSRKRPQTWEEASGEMSPVECEFDEEDLKIFNTNSGPQNINALLQQKKQLQNIIKEFKEQDGSAWTSYIVSISCGMKWCQSKNNLF